MSNAYGISLEDEKTIRTRDKKCVYCRKRMKTFAEIKGKKGKLGDHATIEHVNFDGPF